MFQQRLGLVVVFAGLLLPLLTACATGDETVQSGDKTDQSPTTEPDESTSLVVRLTRLQGPLNSTVAIAIDGTVRRWDATNGVVYRTGEHALPKAEIDRVFDLAADVPGISDMGTGVEEGDILFLNDSRKPSHVAFIEPRAPDSIQELVRQLLHLTDAALSDNTDGFFLRAEGVDPARVGRLQARKVDAIRVKDLDSEDHSDIAVAAAHAHAYVHVQKTSFERLRERVGGLEFFAILDDGSWIQVGLWAPPDGE